MLVVHLPARIQIQMKAGTTIAGAAINGICGRVGETGRYPGQQVLQGKVYCAGKQASLQRGA